MKTSIRIATRKTPLARQQAHDVGTRLQALYPELSVEWLYLSTRGDELSDKPLYEFGGKGLFLKELEIALMDKRADVAVHSMKDVPQQLPEGLIIHTITERCDVRDAWVSNHVASWEAAPAGTRVGTTSLRRASQIKALNPQFDVVPIRGSIHTRYTKMQQGECDAIVLACAGIERMNWQDVPYVPLSPDVCVPAAGQGALGIECRDDDIETQNLINPLHDERTGLCVMLERKVSGHMDGDCRAPVGVWARCDDVHLDLHGFIGLADGTKVRRLHQRARLDDHEPLAQSMADALLAEGGRDWLQEALS